MFLTSFDGDEEKICELSHGSKILYLTFNFNSQNLTDQELATVASVSRYVM